MIKDLVQHLLSRRLKRNVAEQGWAYREGQRYSAEATALASLASWDYTPIPSRKAILESFQQRQLADGSWPAMTPVGSPANWPTALVTNTLAQIAPNHPSLKPALDSLTAATPNEAFWLWRLKFRTTDTKVRFDASKFGWGWVSETISWVIPTAMAIIALERAWNMKLMQGREVQRRIALGQAMLLDRMCPGGGWNAGNSVVYGVALPANIEATAIALAALRGRRFEGLEPSLSFMVSADCQSAYSLAWKILALHEYAKDRPELRPILDRFRDKLELLVEDPRQIEDNATLALSVLAIEGRRSPLTLGASI